MDAWSNHRAAYDGTGKTVNPEFRPVEAPHDRHAHPGPEGPPRAPTRRQPTAGAHCPPRHVAPSIFQVGVALWGSMAMPSRLVSRGDPGLLVRRGVLPAHLGDPARAEPGLSARPADHRPGGGRLPAGDAGTSRWSTSPVSRAGPVGRRGGRPSSRRLADGWFELTSRVGLRRRRDLLKGTPLGSKAGSESSSSSAASTRSTPRATSGPST